MPLGREVVDALGADAALRVAERIACAAVGARRRVQVETGPGRVGSEGAHGRGIRRGAAQSGGDVRRRVLRNRAAAEHAELRCGGAGTARRDVGARGRDAEADDDGREGAAEGNARYDASGGLAHS